MALILDIGTTLLLALQSRIPDDHNPNSHHCENPKSYIDASLLLLLLLLLLSSFLCTSSTGSLGSILELLNSDISELQRLCCARMK
jgi:hypothetical protein